MSGWASVTLNDDAGKAFRPKYDVEGDGFGNERRIRHELKLTRPDVRHWSTRNSDLQELECS